MKVKENIMKTNMKENDMNELNLNEMEQRYYGGTYRGLLTTVLDELFKEQRIIM